MSTMAKYFEASRILIEELAFLRPAFYSWDDRQLDSGLSFRTGENKASSFLGSVFRD
jgi:hypothetical protein